MRLEGNWMQAKGRIREAWASLTDDELEEAQGNWEQLVGKIQAKTGEAVAVVERKLDDIADSIDEPAA
ncbi:MAG: CsbD family protein [Actinomycetota bacterium]|nr:CsbD family protein [Actinomycetota bacterium]